MEDKKVIIMGFAKDRFKFIMDGHNKLYSDYSYYFN